MLRDEAAVYCADTRKRRQYLKEILSLEENELGAARAESPVEEKARAKSQQKYAEKISRPVVAPERRFTNFLKAPRTLRGNGNRSLDVLFSSSKDGTFWLYGSQKVGQSTLGSLANRATPPSPDEIRKSHISSVVKRHIDSLMNVGSTKERCGLIFDLVSTSKIISTGIPHEIGALIYEYIDEVHYDKLGLKFVFVGITDNVNCCAARDVFCRDDMVAGRYVGDTKRPFDALDNVHMFTVFPGHRLHPFSRGPSPTSPKREEAEESRDQTFLTQQEPNSVNSTAAVVNNKSTFSMSKPSPAKRPASTK